MVVSHVCSTSLSFASRFSFFFLLCLQVPTGDMPRHMQLNCTRFLTDQAFPGDRLIIHGVLTTNLTSPYGRFSATIPGGAATAAGPSGGRTGKTPLPPTPPIYLPLPLFFFLLLPSIFLSLSSFFFYLSSSPSLLLSSSSSIYLPLALFFFLLSIFLFLSSFFFFYLSSSGSLHLFSSS